MEILHWLAEGLRRFVPLLGVIALTAVLFGVARGPFARSERSRVQKLQFAREIALLLIPAVGLVMAIIALPIGETMRGQLLSLLGLVFTAVIALSSTTIVANVMAGLMLRIVRNFRLGDFIRVDEHFGRVTELDLFHTEIQTEDRDLTTLPNLFLITNPVSVVHSSGTVVSASLSLGYDVDHRKLEPLFLEAALGAGLQEPFVQILELGDFSVKYRIAGFLPEVKQIITVRSRLRTFILDTLHDAGIEIVSPTFMNQRQLSSEAKIPKYKIPAGAVPEQRVPEERVFDKADRAETIESLGRERDALLEEIERLEAERGNLLGEELERVERELSACQQRSEAIEGEVETLSLEDED